MGDRMATKREGKIEKCPKCKGEIEVLDTNIEIEIPRKYDETEGSLRTGTLYALVEAHRCKNCGFIVELYAR